MGVVDCKSFLQFMLAGIMHLHQLIFFAYFHIISVWITVTYGFECFKSFFKNFREVDNNLAM